MIVIGIETSCDETGLAVYDSESGLLGHKIYSQIKLHNEYGGVVPELASRDHIKRISPLLTQLLAEVRLDKKEIDGVAYTRGPGLIGALLVGSCFARTLAFSLGIPSIGVHHLEGHLLAPMLEKKPPEFPFLALLVSGGHTQLVKVNTIGSYQIIGESVDDAVGEAFDKVAKMLDLNYPGGPHVEKLAREGQKGRFTFPKPMCDRPGFDFSFSGLKTYTLNAIQKLESPISKQDKADIAYAFEEAVVETLVFKCKKALVDTGFSRLVLAGGVSANLRLQNTLKQKLQTLGVTVFYARNEFCTDNGAMIAYAGCQRLMDGQVDDLTLSPKTRWSLETLPSFT